MSDPKILVLDIETSPIIAYAWGTHDVNIALNQIKKEWSVIAWAAKWLDKPASSVMYMDNRMSKNFLDDKRILTGIWKLLDRADIVITQNGQSFDSPKLNARFIMNGMKPPSPYKHLDTYRIARHAAAFTSNKLEYLSEKLCTKYKKLKHNKYPGMELWTECLDGNKDAWNEMKRYNIHDVLATEELYHKLKAWAPLNMPNAFSIDRLMQKCRTCGDNSRMRLKGFEIKKTGRYHRYQCQKCFTWTTGSKE